ncbi:CBS domain-containing protein [Pseudooceanicola sp.]|uniref:CBS domain-containing protein n=1 Tax=Pseudooceanicola sp. TaxID=1914328 RepID=UPI004059502B
MQISDVMTTSVRTIERGQSIRDAAEMMKDLGAGMVPVADGDSLVGAITDRDIAVRAVAEARGADTAVSEVMTEEVRYCFDDQDVDEVARNMGEQQLHRLPVVNRDKRLVGIVALADIAFTAGDRPGATALSGISEPRGAHAQS